MKRGKSFDANADSLPVLSDHDVENAPDVVTNLKINYEWRRLLSDTIQSKADSIIHKLDDALVDDYRNKFQALLNDLYTDNINIPEQYRARVLATNPIRYNHMEEGAGLNYVDISGNNHTGLYTGITWDAAASPTGNPAPLWDGTGVDYANIFSAPWASAFNFDEGCALIWFKVQNAGVWTDGIGRRLFEFTRNGNNQVIFGKTSVAGQIQMYRRGNGSAPLHVWASGSPLTWQSVLLSWSVLANQTKSYVNGTLLNTLAAALATGTGLPTALVGAASTSGTSGTFSGWLSNFVVWDTPVDADKIALMTI